MSVIDLAILIEIENFIIRFNNIWNYLSNLENRDLAIYKSKISINRELEMIISNCRNMIPSIKIEIENIINILKNNKERIYNKIL